MPGTSWEGGEYGIECVNEDWLYLTSDMQSVNPSCLTEGSPKPNSRLKICLLTYLHGNIIVEIMKMISTAEIALRTRDKGKQFD